MAGEAWHAQVVASQETYGTIQLAITHEPNVWHAYLNSHLDASPTLSLYVDED